MKQFNLEEYLANPSKKVVTMDGRNVRITCTDVKRPMYPILALVDNGSYEVPASYTENGEYYTGGKQSLGLLFAPEKYEGWINIYKKKDKGFCIGNLYDSKEKALVNAENYDYVTTIKIEWEE